MADGNYATKIKNNIYYTKSSELSNKLQTLASLNGSMCTIRKTNNGCYALYISKKRLANIIYNDSRTKNKAEIIKYTGKVYCATISTGLLMVRRNGFICLCGNCSPLEHCTFSFLVEGISRACSHQIVRHRIASYSQQSQRYVKLDQFEYIVPPEIGKNEKAKEIFIKHMESSQKAYDELVDILKENHYNEELEDFKNNYCGKNWDYLDSETKYNITKKMKARAEKKSIEDARYVFPNACETKIMITMNARSLLNFFNERCCERAQWEIRELATQMLKEVKKVAPTIFKNAGPNCLNGPCPEGNMSCEKIKEVREKFKELEK